MSLSVLARLHALPAALFKQGLLGLPVTSEQKRWQHHKASTTWLLEYLLLANGSCSVLASHSELCAPLTRWMLADGNTLVLFNYLKCCIQIYLWHSTIEQGVCCPYPIFDRLFSYFPLYKTVEMILAWVLTHIPCSAVGLPCRGFTLAIVDWDYLRDSTQL